MKSFLIVGLSVSSFSICVDSGGLNLHTRLSGPSTKEHVFVHTLIGSGYLDWVHCSDSQGSGVAVGRTEDPVV